MNQDRPFDVALEAWLDDGPTTAPSDLGQEIQDQLSGRRQDHRPFRTTRRFLMSTRVARAAAAAVAVLAIAGGAYWLGGQGSQSPVGADGSPSAEASVTAEASPTASPGLQTGTTATPTPRPEAISLCLPSAVSARITSWEGAAGSRIATVELRNAGATACLWPVLDQPQLVDGSGAILIDGAVAPAGDVLNLAPGDVVTTLVRDSNYCPFHELLVVPVTVAFILPGGAGRVIADPVTPTDLDGVPPCNGAVHSPGEIEMHPWSR